MGSQNLGLIVIFLVSLNSYAEEPKLKVDHEIDRWVSSESDEEFGQQKNESDSPMQWEDLPEEKRGNILQYIIPPEEDPTYDPEEGSYNCG